MGKTGKLIIAGVAAFSVMYLLRKTAGAADPDLIEELVADPIYFEYDSQQVTPEGYERLVNLAELLNQGPWIKVIVTGHTDSAGGARYNQELGMRRAASVAAVLDTAGLQKPPGSVVNIRSLGSTVLFAANDTAHGRALNRRVEVEIVL